MLIGKCTRTVICAMLSIIVTFLVFAFVYDNLKYSQKKSLKYTKLIRKSCSMNNEKSFSNHYKPKTGDLVVMQHERANLHSAPEGVKHVPTHAGMIWVVNEVPCILEATRFGPDEFFKKDLLWDRKVGAGVRLISLSDSLKDKVIFAVRPLLVGTIDETKLKELVHGWAKHLKFEKAVGPKMNFFQFAALGTHWIFPKLGKIAAKMSGIYSRKSNTVFCSEFIALLLQKLGHLNLNFQETWSLTPITFLSTYGKIDKLSKNAINPLSWGEEISLICSN